MYMETTAITLDPFMPTKFEVGLNVPVQYVCTILLNEKRTKAVGYQYVATCTFFIVDCVDVFVI